jgi:arylsulfatase A-like enzyme
MLAAAAAGSAGCSLGTRSKSAAKDSNTKPPNFIIIFVDDQGYQDLGCYGSPTIKTPCIDRMAAEGVRFTDFYVAAPICSPSRAALLTGCYPARVGLGNWVQRPDSRIGIHPDEVTLAELLRQKGYATACIGKWHLGFLPPFVPTSQGFDYYFGLYHNLDLEADYLADEGGVPILRNGQVVKRPADPAELTELYTAEAIRFIRRSKDGPFFLYLPHTMAHQPLGISEKFKGKSEGGLYGDVIECLDWSTGRILDTLRQLDLDRSTIVIYTSDNGPGPGASALPLRGRKLTTYEGGLRVPCIAWGPGHVAGGKVCHELVTSMDFYPTFANLSGARLPSDRVIDGRDLGPLFAEPDKVKSPHDAFFYHGNLGELAAVRSGKWKLFLNPQPVLYNLEEDIAEQNNVFKGNAAIVRELRDKAIAFQEDMRRNMRPAGQVR